jgi:uncharacterized protein (DUF927 family)
MMHKSNLTQSNATIEFTSRGVFQIGTTPRGEMQRRKIASPIRLRAIGKRDSDEVTMAQIRFRTMHGDCRSEFFRMSDLLEKNRGEIQNKLADLGYEWPENENLSRMILREIAKMRPPRQFRMIRAPGWYDSMLVIPGPGARGNKAAISGTVFARGSDKPEFYFDPDSDAHLGAFVLGEGSLRDWQEFIAKPSRLSSCLRLSIAAALAAPFLRRLGLDSFGINWFSDTSDGKSHSLYVAASVAGLMGAEGLPSWADSQPAIEALARGHRDCVMPLDETADGEDQMPLEKKARQLAFLIARNRPRRLARTHERNHSLENREFRIILLSTSERALGQIARAANAQRLGGEEVRFIDIPASDPKSSGIFDAEIKLLPGKTLRETTKELVETLKVKAIKHQGHAFRALMERYVNDPDGLEHVRTYKDQFEREAVLSGEYNAHYRIRSNFAVMYAAAALAIDYKILPWKKQPTFRAIEKCMRRALATMQTGLSERASTIFSIDPVRLGNTLKKQIDRARLVSVKPKEKVTEQEARARRKADGFVINGAIYVKPDRFKYWIPNQFERNALKERNVIRAERDDTATVEKKIGGIKGKPRYYAIDLRALRRLVAGFEI